ncbi:hypothetical protein MMC32_007152 [Xylographa parallela]|nr:hypothetical protein [Xylographa parallela]
MPDLSEVNAANADFAAAIKENPPSPWATMNGMNWFCNPIDGQDLWVDVRRLRRFIDGQYQYSGLLYVVLRVVSDGSFEWPTPSSTGSPIGKAASESSIGCLGVIVGTIVVHRQNDPVVTGSRFLLSFFGALSTTAAPLCFLEIASPQYRGTIARLYNTT